MGTAERAHIQLNKEITVPESWQRALNCKQAADYLGVAYGSMNNWRCQGKGPRYSKYNNGRVVYFLDDLDKYIADHSVETIDSLATR